MHVNLLPLFQPTRLARRVRNQPAKLTDATPLILRLKAPILTDTTTPTVEEAVMDTTVAASVAVDAEEVETMDHRMRAHRSWKLLHRQFDRYCISPERTPERK
jgi:hypothetical protein